MLFMPRPRKPYVQREVTRHGKTVWYFRRPGGPRVRLPGVFGSPEFSAAYEVASGGGAPARPATASKASLRWLVDQYYDSGRFSMLQPNTKRNHRLMLESVCRTGGDLSFRGIGEADIREGLVRREKTPRMADTYVGVMRALFAFAISRQWLSVNPVGPEVRAEAHKSDGYHTWTPEEIERYQARHPVGTQARLALDIMLYTGLRRSDAVRLGRQHVRNGVIQIRAGKNGSEITIPLLPPLAASIEATTTGDMVFMINNRGEPWQSLRFGYWFADRCDEAKVPGRAHGLRKAGATIAANNGATAFELTAMFGWSSVKMAEIYTAKADRVRLAERAANRLYPHPAKGAGKTSKSMKKIKGSRDGD